MFYGVSGDPRKNSYTKLFQEPLPQQEHHLRSIDLRSATLIPFEDVPGQRMLSSSMIYAMALTCVVMLIFHRG